MTPKEKANELKGKFFDIIVNYNFSNGIIMPVEKEFNQSEILSLITVDEILKLDIYKSDQWYWEEVKEEINGI